MTLTRTILFPVLLVAAGAAPAPSGAWEDPPAPEHTVFEEGESGDTSAGTYGLYLEGLLHEERGEIVEAARAFEEVIRLDPSAADAHGRLASIYLERNEPLRALPHAEAAVRGDPDSEDYLTLLARSYLAAGRGPEAIERFKELLGGEVDQGAAHYLLSMLYGSGGDEARAHAELEKAVEAAPEHPFYRFRLGESFRARGELDRAEEAYRSALERAGNDRPILQSLGSMYKEEERWEEAAEVFEELAAKGYRPMETGFHLVGIYLQLRRPEDALRHALFLREMDPQNDRLRSETADLLAVLGRDDEALEQYRLLWKSNPEEYRYARRIAEIHIRQEDYPQAESVLRRVLAEKDGLSWVWTQLSYVLFRTDRGEESVALIERASTRLPEDANIQFLLANAYLDEGRGTEALQRFDRALELGMVTGDLLFRKGVLENELGRTEDAMRTLRRLIDVDPNHASGLNYLGYMLADKGLLLEQAEMLIHRALQIDPQSPYFRDSLGWVYYRQGRFEEAARELEWAVRGLPEDRVILEHLADAYAGAGRSEEAKEIYRRLLGGAPSDENLREKLKRLGETP